MRAFRWLFILGGVIVALLALGITLGSLWLNTFIHSAAFRHEVEARASQTLAGPIQIREIEFSFFSGVNLLGVTTQIDSSRVNGQGSLAATVESVNCTYALTDLLERRLKLTGVTLEKPQIVLTRQSAGAVASVPWDASGTPADENPGRSAPFQFILESAKISEGSLSVRSAAGASLAQLNGVNAEADTSGYYEAKSITGKLKIADVAFGPSLRVSDLSTSWTFDPRGNQISAGPFAASALGGRLAGDYLLDTTGPSILEVNANGLDVAQIGRTANPSSPVRLSGSLNVQSKWRGVESGQLNGEGDAQLIDGRLKGVDLMEDLAGILRLEEMASPRLRSVHTHFEVANGRTRFTGLQLDAGTFQMTGDGVIGADGALDAHMVLILSTNAMGRLPHEAAAFFVQQPIGSGSIAFHLGGTIQNPRTDLATRILMQGAAVKNVISNALNRFFHKHK